MKLDRRALAWQLVCAYIDAHLDDLPSKKRSDFRKYQTAKEQSAIAPLGALIDFELARLKLSYQQASLHIGRNLPENIFREGPVIAPSTLFYFKKPERATWRAQADTLEQLSYGFGWDMAWLRKVNTDPEGETERQGLPEPIAAVVEIMRNLPPDRQIIILSFAANMADPHQTSHSAPFLAQAPARS